MFLSYSDTDGPVAFGLRWPCCIWAQMVPLHSCTHGPIGFGHRWSMYSGTDGPFPIQAQMVLLHLGTDGPIAFMHTCSYWIRTQMVPSLIRHRWSWCIWAQMVPLHSYIQVPMGTRHKWRPHLVRHRWSLFRHRWSCCIWAQMVPLHCGTDGPCFIQAQIVLLYSGTDSPIACGHRSSLSMRAAPITFADS